MQLSQFAVFLLWTVLSLTVANAAFDNEGSENEIRAVDVDIRNDNNNNEKNDNMTATTTVTTTVEEYLVGEDAPEFVADNAGSLITTRELSEHRCPEPFVLDFSTKGDGSPVNHGDYVRFEWRDELNIRIKAEGFEGSGTTPNNAARVIDTLNPGVAQRLGAPNAECITGGPGRGNGGRPGEDGENCKPLGNALLVQSHFLADDVLDNNAGGKIIFYLSTPRNVDSLGILGVSGPGGKVRVTTKEDLRATIKIKGLGENSYQRIPIELKNVVKVQVTFARYGAVTDIKFCNGDSVPGTPAPTPAPVGHPTPQPVTTPSPTVEKEPRDLNIRFNKVILHPGDDPTGKNPLPMEIDDYPLSKEVAAWLRQTTVWTVIRQEDCGECDILTPEFIAMIGGEPSHPTDDPDGPFWKELLEVAQIQIARRENQDPRRLMPMPRIWSGYTIAQVAEAVHDEFPGVHHIKFLEGLLAENVQFDRDIIPSQNDVDFVRGAVMLSDMNSWCIGTVGPHNFGLKWYVGRARPEEVAYKLKTSQINPDYVPDELMEAISDLHFPTPEEFTAYEEGCPVHPAWPAMHSAASAGSLWMPLVMKLSHAQWCEAKAVDYGIAYARTVAGVHYPTDNIAGLMVGQEILARKLPWYLSQRYGSDPIKVKEKVESLRFDWRLYLESDCFPRTQ